MKDVQFGVFSWEPALWTQTSQERVVRMRRSKIDHSNFRLQQRLLSIEMKTKLVQHVESDWMRDWKSVRVRKSESEREWEWESVRVSFEHRHENKSCSEHSNIHTIVVPSFCLTFRHFYLRGYPWSNCEKCLNIKFFIANRNSFAPLTHQ